MDNRNRFNGMIEQRYVTMGGVKAFDPDFFEAGSVERQIFDLHRTNFDSFVASARSKAKPTLPSIHFEYYDLPKITGIAGIPDGQEDAFIGITVETVLKTYDAFFRIMSHPNILPHIGIRTAEMIQPYHGDGLSLSYQSLAYRRASYSRDLASILPRDPDRRALAFRMGEMAIDFLMHHEIGHIVLGHCQIDSPRSFSVIDEASSAAVEANRDAMMLNQVIESQADHYALSRTFYHHVLYTTRPMDSHERRGRFEVGVDLADPPHERLNPFEAATCDLVFSYYMICWFLGFRFDPETIMYERHPPNYLRFYNCLMLQHCKHRHPITLGCDTGKSCTKAIDAAIFRVTRVIELLEGKSERDFYEFLNRPETLRAITEYRNLLNSEIIKFDARTDRVNHFIRENLNTPANLASTI